jgi:16S rRNA processing protein RimM
VAQPGGRRDEPSHLVVGHVARPHGTKGEVFVWPLTDHPDAVFSAGQRLLLGDTEGAPGDDAIPVEVERARPFKRGLLVGFEGYPDRTAVEPFGGRYLLRPRAELPEPESDEWYYHQLLGMEVETVGGERVGRIREVYELDPTDMLDVVGADGRSRLIPFAARIVRQVDAEAGRLVIEPPEGLLDL